MSLRTASFCTLLLLVGCAVHTEQPAPKVQATRPAGDPGIILAMRPVRADSPEPARILLSGLDAHGAFADGQVFEFIVRTESGTTIAIVQPRASGLRPGEHVSILHGTETRIDVAASD
jgi:hypothetical protein